MASALPSGAQTPSLTHLKRHPDLQALKSEGKTEGGEGIETPGHAHHFSNKGIDPSVLNSSLKKHIAKGAHQGERRLNDFSAEPTDRLNPHFAETIEQLKETTAENDAPAEEGESK
ncbi:hypothetical protein M408DRAFT_328849 [Serendipita vermifera MAFF 305830]|uniref:Uncharacterized protein n=1 Tax=Serendipita vermifera MAFF 305830 TaxID=933852 RepID=A0A0C3AYN6_SERVB|nr:hypothetical protein M408DRAFT_328849 [Serendipita vermifera MAFF 305830]